MASFAYRYPVDVLVRRLKYSGALQLAPTLAEGLSQAVTGRAMPDLLVAMPLSLRRLRQRGYNQAHEIARRVAARCGRPLKPVLERLRDTQAQAGLTAVRRRDNLIDAFRCSHPLAGLRVALVDDVMTSGATLDAAARTLKGAGACHVAAWVVARTPAPEF
ncbi:MAG: ComF family protein [Betaproteobacteria bacterium]|nr:ComF family protein [Betaproteobacteria bacterium]MDE2623309.1 ComF family protein [Betaproteobacteria bacterium]